MRGQSGKSLVAFEIPIVGLKVGTYQYEFTVDDAFWAHFAHPDLKKGAFTVHLSLNKSERVLTLDFAIEGAIELTCDRSLRRFEMPLQLQEQMLYKYGQTVEELNESVWQIPAEQESINVAQHIYEFIGLAVPMKKIHPEVRRPEDDEEAEELLGDESFLVYSSAEEEDTRPDNEPADPRLAALKKLKNKGNHLN